ncbi:MAG: threonine--tRNA ligase [Candidatus Saccharibacteria bacterium]|nr:threonine--tRNA ligase [Candidatus Saccharibacteria bacterium]
MTDKNEEKLYAMRHSLAHIMATAVTTLWPEAKLGIGPVVEHGFYYDIDIPNVTISEDDFKVIEKAMHGIINQKQTFIKSMKPIEDALKWAKESKQPYKQELLNDLKREGTTLASELDSAMMGLPAGISGSSVAKTGVGEVSFYTNGDFTDLCRGPHVDDTGKVGAFKLMRVAGAYWRGDEKNPQMQRLYGVAFETKEELNNHLLMLEEAKKRDHRKLGKELDLFVFSDLVGSGLPLFTPRGTVLREEIGRFSQELQGAAGYQRVSIPHMAKIDLYKTSGHYDKYPERFSVTSFESDDEFMMKPMNCPHHTQIYASQPRSYKDLPIRYMENTVVYRDEKAGELHGLIRVRGATQDDAHVFCRPDQIEEEFTAIMTMIRDMYNVFDLKWKARLSFRDQSDKYLGDPKLWESAQNTIEEVAKKLKLDYSISEGDAAFYGPKIDVMATDALGREWQLATEQLDFVQPERFELEYVDDEGNKKRPVMIHKALLGSFERFLGVYIEHTAGRFPVWIAPEQIRISSVNQEDSTLQFVNKLKEEAQKHGLRVGLDNDNESVGKKIRNAEKAKVPYMLVVGVKEIETGEVTPRIRGDLQVQEPTAMAYENFFKSVANEAKARVGRSSL